VHGICKSLRNLIDRRVVEVLWKPPTDGQIDAYGERLLEAVHRQGVRRLFLDGLDAVRSAAGEPDRTAHFLKALTNELRAQGVTSVYTLEVADIFGLHALAPIGLAALLIAQFYMPARRDQDDRPRPYRATRSVSASRRWLATLIMLKRIEPRSCLAL